MGFLMHDEMADPKIDRVHRFFSGTGPTYDRIVKLGTIGFDRFWKSRILEKIQERPARIMDLACGTGILTFRIAERFPDCHVIGVELRGEYLDIAREKARSMGKSNVEFILSRAEDVLLEEPLDCITSSYLAKYADLSTLIRNAKEMLRKGGLLVMHEFTFPTNRRFAWLWEKYFRLMQTVGTWRYPEWRTVFFELPEFIRTTRWLPELVALLREHSFSEVTIESLTLGASTLVVAKK
jgi:demethylmenaquinone methyltransferase/2-methoxy-6-polyprenyl-1,4-benzoquinol methylase